MSEVDNSCYDKGLRQGPAAATKCIIWSMVEFPIDKVRAAFPALQDDFIFFDNAAGAQSPKPVLDAVAHHLRLSLSRA